MFSVRPPDIVVGGLRFYRDSIFFFFFFFSRQLLSDLAERNLTKTGHMLERECDLKYYVRKLGYTLLLQMGGPKTTFRRLRNLTATLTVHVFGIKHNIHNRASALETARALLHRLQMF